MKRVDLLKKIEGLGCVLIRHGAKHDWYRNPTTGISQPVPRHGEINDLLASGCSATTSNDRVSHLPTDKTRFVAQTSLATEKTNLATARIHLSVERTHLSMARTKLSLERTHLSMARTNLSMEKTHLSTA